MHKAKKTANNTAEATKPTTFFTKMELQFIQMFFMSDFCEDEEDSVVWDYSVNDYLPYKGRIRSGVISSLEQKDIIRVQKKDKGDIAGTYSFTPNGKEILAQCNMTRSNIEDWAKVEAVTSPEIQLTGIESKVLSFLLDTLSYWETIEPTYSNVGVSDVSKEFKISKKSANEVVDSLISKELVTKDAQEDIIYVEWLNTKNVKIEAKKETPKQQSTDSSKFRPYQQYGNHGVNSDLDGFEKGDTVSFLIKGKKHNGTYVHFHKNNHSPHGYIVIKYNNKIYERVPSKVSKVQSK